MSQITDHDGPTWAASDAWVLAAIACEPPKAHTLAELIAIADAVDHNVLTEPEFNQAIGRLLSADLIEADPRADRYWPTQAGASITERWQHGAFTWASAIVPQLQRLGDPQDTDWSLPHGVFARAVGDYLTR